MEGKKKRKGKKERGIKTGLLKVISKYINKFIAVVLIKFSYPCLI